MRPVSSGRQKPARTDVVIFDKKMGCDLRPLDPGHPLGGVYSNPWALRAFIDDARRNHADRLYCLGDLGGYGTEPDAVWPLLTGNDIICVADNYDVAIASGAEDCGCGYRDPRDQEYAEMMYDFTLRNTDRRFAAWMGTLRTERREKLDGCDVHFVHGSTTGLNDFWWESLPEAEHRRRVEASGADVIVCTRSGLPWIRRVGESLVVNVGVIVDGPPTTVTGVSATPWSTSRTESRERGSSACTTTSAPSP
ncbi:hypothetical protein DI270_025320 [Microbispora triticiradicis]|uniref:Calcineurin-like phosphoesterase domain-containing protein n=1 Tax=Microbispora triticiradicis TaxID=2200763 RepID=A0ABX9LE39_9ACTN|nr:metallophosphoesterase family protein [Microbispora triticiradicis]RGA02241.1 hypothetical protein DI270_025320 [Microbispora triticiradicis]GLW22547.1 hypothetical protein Mame01_25900 [Microbispora amethystogenes]